MKVIIAIVLLTAVTNLQAQLRWKAPYLPTFDVRSAHEDLAFYDEQNGAVVGRNPGVVSMTTDGGATWQSPLVDSGYAFWGVSYSFDPPIYRSVLAVGSKGLVFYSSNGGVNWSKESDSNSTLLANYGVTTLPTGMSFIVGEKGRILRRTAGPLGSLIFVNSPVQQNLRRVSFATDLVGFAVGDSGTAIKTIDGGMTWTVVPTGIAANINDVKCLTEQIVLLACDSVNALISKDQGATWTTPWKSFIDGKGGFRSVDASDENHIVFTGSGGGAVWYTQDGFQHWKYLSNSCETRITACQMLDTVNFVVAGWGVSCLRRTEATPAAVSSHDGSDISVRYDRNAQLLRVEIGERQVKEISVYDILGMNVVSLMPEQSAGSVAVRLASLLPGIYHVRLEGDETVTTKKFIVY